MHNASQHIAGSMHELVGWRNQWNALADARQLPLVKYEWFLAAETHLATKGTVRVVYILDASGELCAAAALELRHNGAGPPNYQILGMARLYEPSALLYRDQDTRQRLLQALATLDRPTVLARLWEEIEGHAPGKAERLPRRALWFSKLSAPSQYLEFTDDYPSYIAQLPSQRRYDLRRAHKRAEAAGNVRYELLRPSPSELGSALQSALEVESRSWKGDRGSCVLANKDLRGFFFDMLERYATNTGVLVALLYVDSNPIGAQISLLAYGRLWILKIGYDNAFHKLSPGLILMNHVIEYSYNLGLRGIEFLGSAERWLDAWRPSQRDYRMLASYPYNTRSLVKLGWDAAGKLLRRVR